MALTLLLAGCGGAAPEAPPPSRTFTGGTMGTTYAVTVVAALTEPEAARLAQSVQDVLDEVDGLMSTYDPASEVSRLNAADAGRWVPLSPPTVAVLGHALEITALTGGAFDVTVAPLVDAWGFGPDGPSERAPTADEIATLRGRIGAHRLELAPDGGRKTVSGARVDLSALAKGFGVDRVAESLERAGVTDYLVEVGGEVRTAGDRAAGGPWRVGIERPSVTAAGLQRIVELSGRALATSGDYRNVVDYDGQRYSHTIDPRTGVPVTHGLASVSVVHERCMTADALATALEVLGPDEGYRLAEREGWAVLLVVREADGTFTERETRAFARYAALE